MNIKKRYTSPVFLTIDCYQEEQIAVDDLQGTSIIGDNLTPEDSLDDWF